MSATRVDNTPSWSGQASWPLNGQQQSCREYFTGQGFLPVGLDTYAVFKTYDTGFYQFHELTATVSSIWAFGFYPLYKIIEGYLCSVWFYKSGEVYFYIQRPAGGADSDATDAGGALQRVLMALREIAAGAGLPSLHIWAVDDTLLAELRAAAGTAVGSVAGDAVGPAGAAAAAGSITAECSDDYSEYLYRVADIVEWNGGVNLNKRNSLKRCFATPDVALTPLTKDNFAVCLEIEDEWCSHQDCEACRAFAGCARDSLKNMGKIFDPAIHGGLLLYVGGKPVGYAIWEVLGAAGAALGASAALGAGVTAYVYFAKANITNFNVYLYYTMAKDYLPGVEFLNNGYDMGKMGLRTFKRHLGVHTMMKKYLCSVH